MYVTYTADNRIVISEHRLSKKDIERYEDLGVEFPDYDDIDYEKYGATLLIETSSHVSVDTI